MEMSEEEEEGESTEYEEGEEGTHQSPGSGEKGEEGTVESDGQPDEETGDQAVDSEHLAHTISQEVIIQMEGWKVLPQN